MPSTPNSSASQATDAAGRFTFRPHGTGYFNVRVQKKEGFIDSSFPYAPPSSEEITLTAAQLLKEVRLFLTRPARISGSVKEADTSKPVAGIRVAAARVMSRGGYPVWKQAEARADANGEFAISGLLPGDYAVEVFPKKEAKERVLWEFSEADLKAVDQDYEHTYWPGGHGVETAFPVAFWSGGAIDVGSLAISRIPHYRVRVRFASTACAASEKIRVFEWLNNPEVPDGIFLAEAPCRPELLVTGLAPGIHRLLFEVRNQDGSRSAAVATFTIADENIEVSTALDSAMTVDGEIIAADGAKLPDLAKVSVHVEPQNGQGVWKPGSAAVDETGKFRIEILPPLVSHRISVYGLSSAHYVQEIRYNGIALPGSYVEVSTAAVMQRLTVVIDDKAATVAGGVFKNGDPVSRPVVFIAKWPLPTGENFLPARSANADERGQFRFGGLAPGEYRVVAVTRESMSGGLNGPSMRRLLERAGKIEVRRGASVTANLSLTESW
jgi:protocatechuate 3,4-dioxygenase beta subunit